MKFRIKKIINKSVYMVYIEKIKKSSSIRLNSLIYLKI